MSFPVFCGETDNTLFKFSQSSVTNLPPINRSRAHCEYRTSSKHRWVRIYMTERSVFPVWRSSQFIHWSDASVNDKGVNRMKEQSSRT